MTTQPTSSDYATAYQGASSPHVYELEKCSAKALEPIFLRGKMPSAERLAGWEYRGLNVPTSFKLLGIKKFIKGFHLRADELYGYNCPAVQNGIHEAWIGKPKDDNPKRFGFYHAGPVDPTAKDNKYLNAILLDYGRGGNPALDPSQGLRDYVVSLDDNDDLLLGKAYYAVGPLRVHTNFFILERHRPGLHDVHFRS